MTATHVIPSIIENNMITFFSSYSVIS